VERRLAENLGEDPRHGGVVHQALELAGEAVAAAGDDLGLELVALARAGPK
jgi:hypothetical protein